MTMFEIMMRMWPFWLFGVFMMLMTCAAGYKDLLRVDKTALKKWTYFLIFISIYRYIVFKYGMHVDVMGNAKEGISGALSIPWQAALTVSWEDACHGLPLALLSTWLGAKKYAKLIMPVAIAIVMISFGMGHVYQGGYAAMMLSLYVPYTYYVGKKNGFGTVMIGHILYDLSTLLMLHWMFGG